MHKITLILLTLLSLILAFPKSEALAVCSFCPQNYTEQGGTCVAQAGGRGASAQAPTSGCPLPLQASTTNPTTAICHCVAAGTVGASGAVGTIAGTAITAAAAPGAPGAAGAAPAAAPAAAPCTGPTCTSGSGQRCYIAPGSADDGKPIPPGTVSGSNKTGILTAIGCIPTEPKEFIEGVLKFGTFAAGGIAFLVMIIASLQMITAEGNPESLKNARDKFYSAIIGLLLIVFSVLLMQVIGVDILDLPGFDRN